MRMLRTWDAVGHIISYLQLAPGFQVQVKLVKVRGPFTQPGFQCEKVNYENIYVISRLLA